MANENDSNEPDTEEAADTAASEAEAPAEKAPEASKSPVESAPEEVPATDPEPEVVAPTVAAAAKEVKASAPANVEQQQQQQQGQGDSGRGPGGRGGDRRGGPGGPGGGRRGPRGPRPPREEPESDGLTEKVVFINRCSKVVKGGRRFSFSALVVVGDQEASVGIGFGKANEVAEAIRKASDASRREMVKVPVVEGRTIPHEVIGRHRGGVVMLKPASPGTGIIAGSSVRSVIESAGIKDVLTKSMGSNNHANVVKATLNALQSLRTREQIYKVRGKKLAEQKAI